MASDAAATSNPNSTNWKKYLFILLGIYFFVVV